MRINVLLFFLKIYSLNLLVRHISLSNMSTAVSVELRCSSLLMDRTTLTRGRRGFGVYLDIWDYQTIICIVFAAKGLLQNCPMSNLELQVYCRRMKLLSKANESLRGPGINQSEGGKGAPSFVYCLWPANIVVTTLPRLVRNSKMKQILSLTLPTTQ